MKEKKKKKKNTRKERTGDPTQMVFDAVMAAPCTVMVSYFNKNSSSYLLFIFLLYIYTPPNRVCVRAVFLVFNSIRIRLGNEK